MRQHVHDESESASGGDHLYRWGADRMRRHLRDVHEMTIPMSWDLGRLHQAHLESHQAPEIEETSVPDLPDHSHGDLARWHDTTPDAVLAGHLRQDHGIDTGTTSSWHGLHARAHAHGDAAARQLAQEEAEPQARTVRHNHGSVADWHSNADRRTLAYHLNEAHGLATSDIDVREVYAQHIALHSAAPSTDPEDAAEEEVQADGQRRILVDRIIAAMAGVDFDRDWAADDGLGRAGRYALRAPYQAPAERLLEWLRRGGLAAIPGYLDLLNQEAVEERDAALAAGRASEDKVRELVTQAREAQRAMQEQAQAVGEAESLVHDLEEINNQLRSDLADARDERDRAQQALMAKLTEAGELREQRDTFQSANSEQARMIHEKNAQLARLNTQAEASEEVLRRQRDREREQCQRLQQVLADRTRTLREGRTKLRDLVTRLRDSGWEESSVYQELVHILEETPVPEDGGLVSTGPVRVFLGEAEISDIRHITVDTVGRARAAVEIRRSAKAFRADSVMLFTRDAVANMLDRLADDLEK